MDPRGVTEVRVAASVAIAFVALAGCGVATGLPSPSAAATASPATTATASAPATATPTISTTPTADVTAGFTTYHSAANHLTFTHPNSWIPQECGWVFMWGSVMGVDNAHCPIDGSGGFILAASDNHQQGAFSTISSNLALFAHVQRSSVTVDGLTGTRITADQMLGVGGGSSEIEYDFTSASRTYTFWGTVKWPGYQLGDLTQQFDQLVKTVTFG